MKLSRMINRIEPSLTRHLFDLAKKYNDVIDFTLGDPDYNTPEHIKKAGCDAIMQNHTKYAPNGGLIELRKLISDKVFKETGLHYNPENEVQITVGAMEGLYMSLCCIIDPGDEVIIPSPHWVNYKHMVELLDGVPILVDAKEDDDFVVLASEIKKVISNKTVAIIINSPNNPTGTIYDKKTLEIISRISIENDIAVIFDECYKSIIFDDSKFTSILDFPKMKEHAIVINSCSKKYSMTGWRVGYLVGPSEIVSNMPKLQENIAACVSVPSQYAAIAALKNDDSDSDKMKEGFKRRRDVLVEKINGISKLSVKPPKGTFYAMVNIKQTGLKSEEFAYKLLENEHVAVVPGITYGDAAEGYIRIAFTMDENRIIEGVKRIKRFVDSL